GRISEGVSSTGNINAELEAIKITIDAISSKASKIDSLEGVIEGLKQQFETVASKASSIDNLSLESIKDLGGKIDKIETEISSLSQRADSTAFVGEGLKSVQSEFSNFKQNVFDKTNSIEQKISSVSDTLKRQDESTIEFHKKSEKLFEELQSIKEVTSKSSSDSSKEMMALLKLSEYQSNIRMNSESKYGVTADIEKMASQTADIVNLFDRISIESGEKIPLPHEVRQWAVSKILDCADKWEVRFSDVYSVLTNAIGRDMLKESIRIQQVRDIYGIRAVDEIRKDLNIH
ncbi:MAG: chemotaxis protein, partial [Nitrosopumilus sp.]|nr:chemotaxis protein [Nitrosopumilus sp.]NNL37306.1 chemotaxis protein [Nitrosopumilus sp.]